MYPSTRICTDYHASSPFALRGAGFGLGIFLACLVGFLTFISLCMLIHTGRSLNIYRYAILAQEILGRPGAVFVNVLLVLNGLGSMVSYLISKISLAHFTGFATQYS